jgi:hypothetical protein
VIDILLLKRVIELEEKLSKLIQKYEGHVHPMGEPLYGSTGKPRNYDYMIKE